MENADGQDTQSKFFGKQKKKLVSCRSNLMQPVVYYAEIIKLRKGQLSSGMIWSPDFARILSI